MSCRRKKVNNHRLFAIEVCAFCGKDEDNEVLYGKFIISDKISVHNHCMYLASGLRQTGRNRKDKLFGFRLPDIETELRRGKKLVCCYCRKIGATIGCCERRCQKSFHLPCGIKHGCLNQFFGSFNTFCRLHAPSQKRITNDEQQTCLICCDDITKNDLDSCLYSPCCKKNCFHKLCLQRYALSAGLYFFKCPLCNNSKEFMTEMKKYGIYIPDKDASWELDQNAFQDLLARPQCDAPNCLCPNGRNYCAKRPSGWILLPCSNCGYHARHKNCENIPPYKNKWMCEECRDLEDKISKSKECAEGVVNMVHELAGKVVYQEQKVVHTPVTIYFPSSSSEEESPVPSVNLFDEKEKDTAFKNTIHENVEVKDLKMGNVLHETENEKDGTIKSADFETEKEMVTENYKPKNDPLPLLISKTYDANINIDKSNYVLMKSKNTECFKGEDTVSKSVNSAHKQIFSDYDFENAANGKNVVGRCSVKRENEHNKINAIKRVAKKRKMITSCNNPFHNCIRKYFGQECHKFRV